MVVPIHENQYLSFPFSDDELMKKDFNKLLKQLDAEELRDELLNLYDRFNVVKEYYKLELSGNTKAVLDNYKKALRKSFFTGRRRINRRGRSEAKKVLKAFAEISIHPKDLVDLYFYRAEVMTDAVIYYNIENDSFLTATVKAFEEALTLAENELVLQSLQPQIHKLMVHFNDNVRYGSYSYWPAYQARFGG